MHTFKFSVSVTFMLTVGVTFGLVVIVVVIDVSNGPVIVSLDVVGAVLVCPFIVKIGSVSLPRSDGSMVMVAARFLFSLNIVLMVVVDVGVIARNDLFPE